MMKFNTIALQKATQAAIRAHRAAWDKRQAELDETDAQRAANWVEKYGEEWMVFARRVLRDIKKGRPVMYGETPGYRNSQAGSFHPERRDQPEYKAPNELATMAAILPTIADDEVTTAGLRELGITPATIRAAALHMPPLTVVK
jgi:hypothetical protein